MPVKPRLELSAWLKHSMQYKEQTLLLLDSFHYVFLSHQQFSLVNIKRIRYNARRSSLSAYIRIIFVNLAKIFHQYNSVRYK